MAFPILTERKDRRIMKTLLALKKALGKADMVSAGSGQYLTDGKILVRILPKNSERDPHVPVLFPQGDFPRVISLEECQRVLPLSVPAEAEIYPVALSGISYTEKVSVKKGRKAVDELKTYNLLTGGGKGVWIDAKYRILAEKISLTMFGPFYCEISWEFLAEKAMILGFLDPADRIPFLVVSPVSFYYGDGGLWIFEPVSKILKYFLHNAPK
jgi:hypothetical protein